MAYPITNQDELGYREALDGDLADINETGFIKVFFRDCNHNVRGYEIKLSDLGLTVAPSFTTCKEAQEG